MDKRPRWPRQNSEKCFKTFFDSFRANFKPSLSRTRLAVFQVMVDHWVPVGSLTTILSRQQVHDKFKSVLVSRNDIISTNISLGRSVSFIQDSMRTVVESQSLDADEEEIASQSAISREVIWHGVVNSARVHTGFCFRDPFQRLINMVQYRLVHSTCKLKEKVNKFCMIM